MEVESIAVWGMFEILNDFFIAYVKAGVARE